MQEANIAEGSEPVAARAAGRKEQGVPSAYLNHMKVRASIATTAVVVCLAVPMRAPAADPIVTPVAHIQPGAPMTDPTQFPDATIPYSLHRCTMGFILAGGRQALYMVTAAHCVTRRGARIYDETGRPVGTVVFRLA